MKRLKKKNTLSPESGKFKGNPYIPENANIQRIMLVIKTPMATRVIYHHRFVVV
jgi:hypothetical protein